MLLSRWLVDDTHVLPEQGEGGAVSRGSGAAVDAQGQRELIEGQAGDVLEDEGLTVAAREGIESFGECVRRRRARNL